MRDINERVSLTRVFKCRVEAFIPVTADPDCPELVVDLVTSGLELANAHLNAGNRLLWEYYLLTLVSLLRFAATDPLRHSTFRTNCFNQVYRPWLTLKSGYNSMSDTQPKIQALQSEMRNFKNYIY